MKEIKVRSFINGDESAICEIVKKDVLAENIKDYSKESIEHLINSHNEDLIKRRASKFHVYVLTDNEKIIGVGMIGPYWDSLTESSFFTIFIDPSYKGQKLGRKIIETLENDEYFKRADRVEIPASITAVEFYKHFGYGFKKLGNIVDNEGIYRMEKFPKLNKDNSNPNQYNMKPYVDNNYHNYKEFIYQTKKEAYKNYVEKCWGAWNENDQRKYFENFIRTVQDDSWIIQLNGADIGFYNGETLKDGSYEIGNICIIPEYQGKGIGTQVLKDIMELHKEQDLYIQYFKQNPVGSLYKKLGFEPNGETEFHFQMVKRNLSKSNNFIFRKITKSEFDKLKNLFPDNEEMWIKYRDKRLGQFDNNDLDVYVIEYNNKFIGELSINHSNQDLNCETIPNQRLYLEAFRLDKKYRSLGLGQGLIEYTLDELEKQGYTEFTIGVEDDNEVAKHIYFKFGFTEAIAKGHGNEFDPCEYTLFLKDTKKMNKVARK